MSQIWSHNSDKGVINLYSASIQSITAWLLKLLSYSDVAFSFIYQTVFVILRKIHSICKLN